jgi:hypothetical protein
VTNNPISLTDAQREQVLRALYPLPSESAGPHLGEDDFLGFALGEVPPEEVARIEKHLAGCPTCTAEMERLVEAAGHWSGPAGEERLAALRRRTLPATIPVPEEPEGTPRLPKRYYCELVRALAGGSGEYPWVHRIQLQTETGRIHGWIEWRRRDDRWSARLRFPRQASFCVPEDNGPHLAAFDGVSVRIAIYHKGQKVTSLRGPLRLDVAQELTSPPLPVRLEHDLAEYELWISEVGKQPGTGAATRIESPRRADRLPRRRRALA